MEKAIEIKRRAQRCILNGDLDGALHEYEKLIASGDNDPYHSVLLADLLYKKGEHEDAGKRYLDAVIGYENVGLVKNAIAVCKKMSRLALMPGAVLQRLASLHARDGLVTESSLYYMQHAELQITHGQRPDAERSLREAFQVCRDNVRALERLAEVQEEAGDAKASGATWMEAAREHDRLGQIAESKRCRGRAESLVPGIGQAVASAPAAAPAPEAVTPSDSPPPLRQDTGMGGRFGRFREAEPEAAPSVSADSPEAMSAAQEPPADEPQLEIVGREEPSGVDVISASLTRDLEPETYAEVAPAKAGASHDDALHDSTPARPGIADHANGDGAAAAAADADADAAALGEVSEILNQAQSQFRHGDRQGASATLVRAAQAYDRLGKFDNAAAIYRSLSQANEAPLQVMLLWLKNCQRRDDGKEAARVACELGDRALLENDRAGARDWFERAKAFDPDNALAARRLQRLATPEPAPAPAPAPVVEMPRPVAVPPPAPVMAVAPTLSTGQRGVRDGMVQVALGNDEPVGMDLGEMIAEFQNGLAEQLEADPQGTYDLGMSYREMGLFDHAVASFRSAAQSPKFRARASEMIGRCLLDQGDFDGAAEELVKTLEHIDPHSAAINDIRYQLGLAFEAGGRHAEALSQFERLYADEANYPGVASKIRALRMATGRR